MSGKGVTFTLLLAGALVGCSDDIGTEPTMFTPQMARPATEALIEDVTGTLVNGTFAGTVQITEFALENGELVVSGIANGIATIAGTPTTITNQEFTTAAEMASPTAVCDILFLDLGPLFLDVLGLTVDLAPIVLDINAVPGSGNLLGNLLCAVVSLLDGPGAVAGLLNILDRINDLLG
jgi:hypothetical protein